MALQPRIRSFVRSPLAGCCHADQANSRMTLRRSRWTHLIVSMCMVLGTWGTALLKPGDCAHRDADVVPSSSLQSPLDWRIPPWRSRAAVPSPQLPEIPLADQPEAPSMIWLVVMPAIPLLGGLLIYVTRVYLGRSPMENRMVQPLDQGSSPAALDPVHTAGESIDHPSESESD